MTRSEYSIITIAKTKGLPWLKKNHSEKYHKLKKYVLLNNKK